jgi:hypothetical protein
MEQAGVLAAAAGGEEVGGAKRKNLNLKLKLEERDGKVENTILSY